MASRPIWRGHIRLALVSCPVALYSARHERGSIRFNMINPETGNRIKMVSQDAGTGAEVARKDTVKGYEFEKGHYVLMTDEDFASVKVESSAMMGVEKFVDAVSIDPIYYDASYYVAPDGKGAEDVYAVLREAIVQTGKVALTRVVIGQRERTVAVRPMDGGLVAHTLNEESDLNDAKGLFEPVQHIKVDPEMVKLAVQLVDRQAGAYDPADLEDRYETRLRALVEAKIAGHTPAEAAEAVPSTSNVIDLRAALMRSLGAAKSDEAAETTSARVAAEKAGGAAAKSKKKAAPTEEARRQPGLKLPIEGGKAKAKAATPSAQSEVAAPAKASRRRA